MQGPPISSAFAAPNGILTPGFVKSQISHTIIGFSSGDAIEAAELREKPQMTRMTPTRHDRNQYGKNWV